VILAAAAAFACTYYHACLELRAQPGGCAALAEAAPIPGGLTPEWNCRRLRREVLLARDVLAKRPRAEATCRELLAEELKAPGQARRLCRELLRGKTPSEELCRGLPDPGGRETDPRRLKGCVVKLELYRGRPVDCDALEKEDWLALDAPFCRAVEALRRKEDCRGDAWCLAVSGRPGSCAPLAASCAK